MSSGGACTKPKVLCLIRPSVLIQNPHLPCLKTVLTRRPILLENYGSAMATVKSVNRPMHYQISFCDDTN